MANKIIQTRIQQKIDTLAKWQAIWETFVPLKGEKILFQIPNGTAQTVEGNGITPPQVISKTGDGVTTLKALPWDSALAADVAAWAKPGDSSYINVPGLAERVSNLETEELPEHFDLGINGIKYNPLSKAVNITIDETANTGVQVDTNTTTGAITIKGLAAGTNLGVVKSGDKVTIENGVITNVNADSAHSAAEAGHANAAAKVDNALTLKTGTKEVVFDGSAAKTFEVTAADLGIDLSTPLDFVGITTTALTDGATTNPIVVNGSNYTAVAGDIVIRKDTDKEFLFVNGAWEELGDADTITKALNDYKTEETAWKTNNWKAFSTTVNGYTNKSGNANNILFGDNTWAGADREDFIVFDCGGATMSATELAYSRPIA